MTFIVLYGLLVLDCFLISLNGFLRGAKKDQIDGTLIIIQMGIVVSCFVFLGWPAGVLSIILVFLLVPISNPLTALLAGRLLAGKDSSSEHIGLPPWSLADISRRLGVRPPTTEQIIGSIYNSTDKPDAREVALNDLLDYCEATPRVMEVMRTFRLSRTNAAELFRTLQYVGAGQWAGGHYVAASAIAYPETLRFLLSGAFESRGEKLNAAYAVIKYFECGKPLEDSPRSASSKGIIFSIRSPLKRKV